MGLWIPKSVPYTATSAAAQIAHRGFTARPELLFGHDHPDRPPILHPVEAMDTNSVVADAPRRFLGHLDLGDQVALRRIPTRKLDARRSTDDAAPSVAPDEILPP